MPGAIDLTAAVLLGVVGAILSVGVTCLIAARWKRRCGISYGISAFVFYVVFYVAAFEYGILDAIRLGKSVPADMLDVLVLGHSAITAFGVTVFTLLVFGLFVGLRPEVEGDQDPMRAYTGCAAFCLIMTALLNPVGAVERLRAMPAAPRHMATLVPPATDTAKTGRAGKQRAGRTPTVYPVPGLVHRVEIKGRRITHYVTGKVRKRSGVNLEAYASMVLAHRLYFDGGKPGPVVIRDAASKRRLATRQPDGKFRSQIARRKSRK